MKESNKEIKNQKTGFFYEWVVPIVIAVILAFLINKFANGKNLTYTNIFIVFTTNK